MAMATSYNWLFLWDYTFYKWGYKYLLYSYGHSINGVFLLLITDR